MQNHNPVGIYSGPPLSDNRPAEIVKFRATGELKNALCVQAARNGISTADFARVAVIEKLRAMGADPFPVQGVSANG